MPSRRPAIPAGATSRELARYFSESPPALFSVRHRYILAQDLIVKLSSCVSIVTAVGLIFMLVRGAGLAATPSSSPAGGVRSATEEAVQMSAFSVAAEKDIGYQGGNTTSGSRLNTSLKDTAASILVITEEFMNDFAMNTLEEITAYTPNMGVEMLETRSDPSPAFISGFGADTRMRNRGLESSLAMDFFTATMPVDGYNIERLEVSSGPNSILFGFGNPGGLVNVMTKSAKLERTRTALGFQFGDWNFHRYELDHNQVLVPGKLAARLNTLYDYGEGWRTNDFHHVRRGALSLRYKPWDRTTVTANGELGRVRAHVALPQNAEDNWNLWVATGSRVTDDSVWTTADRAFGINRSTAVMNIYATGPAGTNGYYIPTRNAVGGRLLVTTYENFNVLTENRAGRTLVDPNVIPFDYSLYGPRSLRFRNLRRMVLNLEQKLTDNTILELAYNRESSIDRTEKPTNQQMILYGDPNLTIPNPTGAGAAIPNPNAGKPFIETIWNPSNGETHQQVIRASLSGKFNFGKWGAHHVAGMYENNAQHIWAYQGRVIFVDSNNVPISNAAPENTVNWVRSRRYFTPGDFSTYDALDGTTPITINRNGVTYHSRSIVQAVGPRDVERTIDTGMLVLQSYFLKSKLVFTGGLRQDRITYDVHGSERYLASHPDVQSGKAIVGELHYTPEIVDKFTYKPTTHTLGAVYHVTPAFSVFYNTSNNNAEPRQNQNILPNETLPPPSAGKTHDYGVMVRLLDGKFFIRATAFETAQTLLTGAISLGGLVAPTTGILDALLANNQITADEYRQHTIGDVAAMVATFDEVNSGYEASAWFNPSRNFTAQLNFAYTETDRSNIAPEFEGWYDRERAFWFAKSGVGNLTDPTTGATINENAAVHGRVIQDLRDFNNFGYGIRPYKVNVTGRYSFLEGRAKGLFIGGGVRWQSEPKLGRRTLGSASDGRRIYGETVYGPESFTTDAFVGYRRRVGLAGRETDLTLQLNVKNLTNENEFMPLRYNANFSGYARVILVEPRQFRGSISLSF